jgi:CRISPR system Cascade subunit CasE
MHAAVERSFPLPLGLADDPLDLLDSSDLGGRPSLTPSEGRVLWRLDEGDHRAVLYVLSPDQPDCSHIVEQAGWPTLHTWQTRSYKPLLDRLETGHTWAFRVAVNPTKSTRLKDGKRSQRVAHVTAAQQLQWFLERANGWGFTIPPLTQDGPPALQVTARRVRSFRRDAARVEISTAVLEGHLVVQNPDLFRASLVRGLGPAKGYGCGLMTLARPHLDS